MSVENYFSLSFSELIGFFVTIISVALIIKQLNDSRLATQMSGYLTLSDQFNNIVPAIEFIDSLNNSEEWNALDGPDAYKYLMENETYKVAYKSVAAFYEILASLLYRGALDKKLAWNTFGFIGTKRWFTIKKAVVVHRKAMGVEELYDQWEWMAENLSKR